MAHLRGSLVVVSGEQDSSEHLLRSVEYLSGTRKSWEMLPSVHQARLSAAGVGLGERWVYVLGGCYNSSVERLDFESRNQGWQELLVPQWQGWMNAGAAPLDDERILVFGDILGDNRNFIFTPSLWGEKQREGEGRISIRSSETDLERILEIGEEVNEIKEEEEVKLREEEEWGWQELVTE